jgi:hypothetical protein
MMTLRITLLNCIGHFTPNYDFFEALCTEDQNTIFCRGGGGGGEIQVLSKNLRQSAQVSVDKVRASSDFWQSTLGSLVLVGIEIHKVLLIRQVL